MSGHIMTAVNPNSVSPRSADVVFEVLDNDTWTCHNCSKTWPQSESIGRHLFKCFNLEEHGLPGLPTSADNQTTASGSCCKFCARTFDPPMLLKRHENQCPYRNKIMDIIEGISVKSDPENSSSDSNDSMPANPRTRNYTCQVCNEGFTGQFSLARHTEAAHGNKEEHKQPVAARATLTPETESEKASMTPSKRVSRDVKVKVEKKKLEKPKINIKSQGKPKLQCTLCPKAFPFNSLLTRHLKSHENVSVKSKLKSKPFKCGLCPATFISSEKLKLHRVNHIKKGIGYKCNFCDARFTRLQALTIHNRDLHSRRTQPLKCATCSMEFVTTKKLFIHLKRMNHEAGQKKLLFPFKCPECPARFTLSYNMTRHCVDKHDIKPKPRADTEDENEQPDNTADKESQPRVSGVKSKQPGVSNASPGRHLTSNGKQARASGAKQEQVKSNRGSPVSSGKQRSPVSTGKQQVRVSLSNGKHTKVPIDKSYSRLSNGSQVQVPGGKVNGKIISRPSVSKNSKIKGQIGVTANDREIKGRVLHCNVCTKPFLYQSNLKLHLKSHSKTHSHECKTCCARFDQLTQLNYHAKSCKLEFGCAFCSERFVHKREQTMHLKTHDGPANQMFQCKLCPTILTSKEAFNSHMETHDEEVRHECKLCPDKFMSAKALKVHQQVAHSGNVDPEVTIKRVLRKSVAANKN